MRTLLGFVAIAIGVVGALSPATSWQMSAGWRFRDAEPSGAALSAHRLGGVLAILAGLVLLVSSCSSGGDGAAYRAQFQAKLLAGEAADIRVGQPGRPYALSAEERQEAADLMGHAPMRAFEPGNAYGAAGEATVVFEDGLTEQLLLFGPSGGVELHLRSGEAYAFDSPELGSRFRDWMRKADER
ncbi:hypothetical protein I8J29_18255 [Paenibacillus sp. MWE-103]|uniref:DUF6199 domain-containing protein n=1 Tax=Paenibacillus artemisiicola TaxID=1172618 RepID=A0ABS3WDI7_9BACL|nr:DUF6199 family natural product biosynthesis protein [Paenibacillus artemisiicola]MBO7746156.1 hypothetical protein [Paenibacillus artemisiicola]